MSALDTIKQLVENGFDVTTLERQLYDNAELIGYLESLHNFPNYSQQPSAYLEIVSQDFGSADTQLNIMAIFKQILELNNISYTANPHTDNKHSFLLKATPAWIPNHAPYVSALYDSHAGISPSAFKALLLDKFKVIHKKPKWLQSADWLIDDEPWVFVGQIDVCALHHDTTYLYVFYQPKTHTYAHIIQSA